MAKTTKQLIITWIAAVFILQSAWLPAAINSGQIVSKTISALSCLQYNPVAGICFWLRCNPKCKIKTSTKIKHWNPDVVVSSYTTTKKSPWIETRAYSYTTPMILQGGQDTNADRGDSRQHVSTTFREVDAIGNPALALMYMMAGTGLLCPSVTNAYVPHHLSSALDSINWRYASIEMLYPASLVPGMREIGSWPMNTWGSVYPRTGFVTQNEGPKAAAVTAQRAGDIITRSWQPHIYIPLGSNCSKNRMKCWAPGALVENDSSTGKWQMLYPKAENSCSVFGKNDVLSLHSWADNKQDSTQDFAWNLWRKYSCCKRKGIFLFSIDF